MAADREERAAGRSAGKHDTADLDIPRSEEGTAPVPARRLRFDILTLFPEALTAWLDLSILKRARDRGLVDVRSVDIRDFTTDRHRTADDTIFGGGPGMLLKLAPLAAAVEHCLADGAAARTRTPRVILLSPQGARLRQSMLEELAGEDQILLICGRYEGVDERARDLFVTDEISIGD
ncbi:MAG: hypothetical protein LC772_00380, partial [Chloroflexi bacterium]|nr:hypothetical protein [Chloroflexota bacterium]